MNNFEIKISKSDLMTPNDEFTKILNDKIINFQNEMEFAPKYLKICVCNNKKCQDAHPNRVNSIPITMTRCLSRDCDNILCNFAH